MPTDNNTFDKATSIRTISSLPQLSTGALDATDQKDWYKFTTTAVSNLNVSLTELTGNAKLRLVRADGITDDVPASDNSGKLSESIIKANLTAGTYYLEVSLSGTAVDASYKLSAFASADANYNSILWRNEPDQSLVSWQMQGGNYSDVRYLNKDGIGLPADPRPDFDLPANYYIAGTGDLNADGIDDVIWRDRSDGSVFTWIMDGQKIALSPTGGYSGGAIEFNGKRFGIGENWLLAGIADMDGNGTADLLWRDLDSGKTGTWNMNGSVLQSVTLIDEAIIVPRNWKVEGLSDTNSDGKADILWRDENTGTVSVWLLDTAAPRGLFAGAGKNQDNVAGVPLNYKITAFKDFTGDGKADVIWSNTVESKVVIWQMDGTKFINALGNGVAGSGTRFLTLPNGQDLPSGYFIAGVGDFDGDKKADLLWRNTSNGYVGIWLLDTSSPNGYKYSGSYPYAVGADYTVEAIKDFSNDGKADILWRKSTGETAVWTSTTFPVGGQLALGPDSGQNAVPLDFAIKGILNSKFTKQIQTLTTGTAATAFNLGVADGTGNYVESVTTGNDDLYRFKLERTSAMTLKLLNPTNTNLPTSAATLELLRENVDGTTTAVTYTDGVRLLSGTYRIKVAAAVGTTAGTAVGYNLRVTGLPVAVDLIGKTFTAAATIALPDVPDPRATNKPKATLAVTYAIENKEPFPSGPVKVRFYLSRDTEIVPGTPDNLLKVVGNGGALSNELVVNDVPGAVNGVSGSTIDGQVTLELPAGDDVFWTTDRTYYIGMVIDPVSAPGETPARPIGDVEEVGELDLNGQPTGAPTNNYNQAFAKDKLQIGVTNTQVPDLLVPVATYAITNGSTFTQTGSINLNYQIQNQGKKSTEGLVIGGVGITYYLSELSTLTVDTIKGNVAVTEVLTDKVNGGQPIAALTTTAVSQATLFLSGDNSRVNPDFWAGKGTQFYLYAFVDDGAALSESDESNNLIKLGPITITA